jgi:DNA polymerase elongation subunit (family B)
MIRLDGEQHYKWGKQFSSVDDFRKFYNMNFRRSDLYTIHNMKENCMVNKGYTYFKGMKIEEISILSFDIETNGLKIDDDSVVYLISNTYKNGDVYDRKLFSLDEYPNQVEMIGDWCKWVCQKDPSLIVGHNINGYDFKFLMNICDLKLGRDSSIVTKNKQSSQFRIDGSMSLEYNKLQCYGREIVDTLFLAYRYDAVKKKYESYGLKNIIRQEGLEKKDRTFIDASKIYKEWDDKVKRELIKKYAIEDADDSLNLFYLMSPAIFYLTQSVPKTFQEITCSATGSQINSVLVRSYLQERHSIAKSSELTGQQVEGGISFAIPGIYKNVFKVDLKSCYPSQILRFRLYDKAKDPNANFYKLVEHFTLQRFEYKEKVKQGENFYKNLDAMAKIFINSSYGVTNTNGLNYNSIELARKITGESRSVIDMALKWASNKDYKYWITKFYDSVKEKEEDRVYMSIPTILPCPNNYNFIITPSDTDSISFCKQDQSKFSEKEIEDLLNELNKISPDKMLWENDGVYDSVVAIRAKNYILRKGDKLNIKGSGLKKSTSEPAIKELFKEFIDCLAHDKQSELPNVYEKYIKEAMNVKDMKRWVVRKTITSNVLNGERTNETKVMDAIKGTDYREGDRVYLYFKPDETLSLIENFDGDYDKLRLVKKVHTAIQTFDTILNMKQFINYSLKKNKDILYDLTEKDEIERDWEISEEVRLR